MACSTRAPGIQPADKGSEIHDPPFLDPPASRDEPIDLIAYWPMIIDSIDSVGDLGSSHPCLREYRVEAPGSESRSGRGSLREMLKPLVIVSWAWCSPSCAT
jgi:hypothetical protein